MIVKKPTVFVLGAGASKPFGLPLAWELKQKVMENLQHAASSSTFPLSHIDLLKLRDFAERLTASPLQSVDAFLEQQPEHLRIGKAAIVQALLPEEREDKLPAKKGDHDWYGYLFNRLFEGIETFDQNQISFVTFNYDRSLEQFLYNALLSSSRATPADVAAKLEKIPILHMYGSLGPLPWQDQLQAVPYGAPPNDTRLVERASSTLQVVHEVSDPTQFSVAHDLIEKAAYVFFLGFAYHRENVERLKPDRIHSTLYRGTTYGMAEGEKADAQVRFARVFDDKKLVLDEEGWDCLDYLKSFQLTKLE